MFDRCDTESKEIIEAALDASRRLGHTWLGTEHLLLAFAERRELLPDDAASLLPVADAVVSALTTALGPRHRDADLLRVVGIDLDDVRSAVRRTFGDEAFEGLGHRRVHQPWQPWRRPTRRCTSLLAGTMSVAPRLKKSLEQASQNARRRQLPDIDPAALLLGMIEVEDAMSNRILRGLGVDPGRIQWALGGDHG